MISIETTLKNHPNLTTTAFCVYYAIYEKIKNRGQKSTIYRIKDIASLCGISPKLVQRSVTQLRDEGLIIIEKQGRDNLYSLPDGDTKTTKKNNGQNRPSKQKKQSKTTVDSDRSSRTNKSISNNSNISLKNNNNIYYQISESDIDSDNPVYREYKRMCTWQGQNFRRGRTEISPEDLAARMAAITPDMLNSIIAAFDERSKYIEHQTAYIQALLLNARDTLRDPHAAFSCSRSALGHEKKPTSKIHFALERSYDFDKLEIDLLEKQHKKYIQSQNAVMVVESDRKEQSNETIKRTN